MFLGKNPIMATVGLPLMSYNTKIYQVIKKVIEIIKIQWNIWKLKVNRRWEWIYAHTNTHIHIYTLYKYIYIYTVVIICAGYCLLLTFCSVKPFSFIRSIVVRSTSSRHIMNRYGANVSPCRTPATILKKSLSPSGEQTFTFVFA